MKLHNDTIVAQASATGKSGVAVIRISGSQSLEIAEKIFKKNKDYFSIRKAKMVSCYKDKEIIDKGIAIYFQGPKSFTGEDVIEFHCHGGLVTCDLVIKSIQKFGARIARAGEFSERAFLNDKIDLAQAEAIADLIESGTEQAARNALRSLQGVFSEKINKLVSAVIETRMYIEASIDFPDEEGVEFLSDGKIEKKVRNIIEELEGIKKEAKQGVLIQEGIKVVIAGEPNAGKSSLLNSLSRKEAAIVTDIAGTTRDVLKEKIEIEGMPVHIIDTAGLRESTNAVEQEGIRRAWLEIENADQVLYVIESEKVEELESQMAWQQLQNRHSNKENICLIENKIDLTGKTPSSNNANKKRPYCISISAKQDLGLDLIKDHLKEIMGYQAEGEGGFTARRRHIDALNQAGEYLSQGLIQLVHMKAGDLLAEDLRLCQNALNEITGEFSSDDLLGEIFSSFCIGK